MNIFILRIIVIVVVFICDVHLNVKASDSKPVPLTQVFSKSVSTTSQGRLVQTNVSIVTGSTGNDSILEYGLIIPEHKKPNWIEQIWCRYPLKNWAVVSQTNPVESYLTWQEEFQICITKLPEPLAPQNQSGFGCGFASSWSADHFINLKDYEIWQNAPTNSDESEVTLTSVSTNLGLTFTATNKLGEQLKFVKSKDGWHAFAGTNEIRRLKVSPIDWGMFAETDWFPRALYTNTLSFKTATGASVKVDVSLKPKGMGTLWTFQLYETTNSGNKLSRPVWETRVAPIDDHWHFTIVENGKNTGYYLCWTDLRGRLCLSAITNLWPEAKYIEDPNVGPFSYPKDISDLCGGVDHIIDLRRFADGERFFKGGGGVASVSQENNVLTLNVTNAAGSKYTFSNQDGQWHAYGFWGEISRIKTNP